MRAAGVPSAATVAKVIAVGSGSSAWTASCNQRRNWTLREVRGDVERIRLEGPACELLDGSAFEIECGVEVRVDAEPRSAEKAANRRQSGTVRGVRRK